MAWEGDVLRRIVAVTPSATGGGCTILFECQHSQPSCRPAETILKWFREYPCDQCSGPSRQRIQQYRESITFDDVLRKIRNLREPVQ